jgi:RNA polymerase sigma factor (sigma-70 family)
MAETGAILEQYLSEVRALALDDDAARPLWLAYKRRPTPQLRLRLWNAYLYKVARIVLKRFPNVEPGLVLDMIQDAAVEITPYIERYRPEDEVPFGAYIHKPVLTYATRTYRRLSTVVKFAHTHGDVDVPGTTGLDEASGMRADTDSPEDLVSGAERADAIEDALSSLDWTDRFVFRAALQPPRRSIEQIAADLGFSRDRVQQALRRALEAIPGSAHRLAAV